MTIIVGGLRARLIRESLYEMIKSSLTQLGWFNAGRPHLPIVFESQNQDQDQEIALNTAALADSTDKPLSEELGSQWQETGLEYYIDFYAENDAIGLHFIKDVRDILMARFPISTTRTTTAFPVYDYRQATPPILFYCDILSAEDMKAHGFLKPWLQHWYTCAFTVIDSYETENG